MELAREVLLRRLVSGTALRIPKCCASTGGRGNTQNVSRPGKKRYRGIKVGDGDYVHPGFVLARQIHKYKFYPGANVMVGTDMTLSSMVRGTVRITNEVFVPNPKTELGKATLEMPMGSLLYKLTLNVVKDEEVGLFKLKEQI